MVNSLLSHFSPFYLIIKKKKGKCSCTCGSAKTAGGAWKETESMSLLVKTSHSRSRVKNTLWEAAEVLFLVHLHEFNKRGHRTVCQPLNTLNSQFVANVTVFWLSTYTYWEKMTPVWHLHLYLLILPHFKSDLVAHLFLGDKSAILQSLILSSTVREERQGDEMSLTCHVSTSSSCPTVTWLHNGNSLHYQSSVLRTLHSDCSETLTLSSLFPAYYYLQTSRPISFTCQVADGQNVANFPLDPPPLDVREGEFQSHNNWMQTMTPSVSWHFFLI